MLSVSVPEICRGESPAGDGGQRAPEWPVPCCRRGQDPTGRQTGTAASGATARQLTEAKAETRGQRPVWA